MAAKTEVISCLLIWNEPLEVDKLGSRGTYTTVDKLNSLSVRSFESAENAWFL